MACYNLHFVGVHSLFLPDRPPYPHLSPPLLLLLSPSQYRRTPALGNLIFLLFVDGSALSSWPLEARANIRGSPVATLRWATPARQKSEQGGDAGAAVLVPTSSHSLTSLPGSPRWAMNLGGIYHTEQEQRTSRARRSTNSQNYNSKSSFPTSNEVSPAPRRI